MISRRLLFPADFQLPPRNPQPKTPKVEPEHVYDAWLASREIPGQKGSYLVPGAQRSLTIDNARLALFVTRHCTLDFVRHLLSTFFLHRFTKLRVFLVGGPLETQSAEDDTHDVPEYCQKPFPSVSRILPGS